MSDEALKAAAAFRETFGKLGGFVLVYANQAYGWKASLCEPENEQPGVLAIAADGACWRAVGGDSRYGAKEWVSVEEPQQRG